MAIDMSNVKNIKFNNKTVKKIEDANGNVLWEYVKFNGSIVTTGYKIYTYELINYLESNKLYFTISQLTSNLPPTSNINDASVFCLLDQIQILALIDGDFNSMISGNDVVYQGVTIGRLSNGKIFLTPTASSNFGYIVFIQNNQMYFIGSVNYPVSDNGLLGYTDNYLNSKLYRVSSHMQVLVSGLPYVDNRTELIYTSNEPDSIFNIIGGEQIVLSGVTITNPNANN